MSPLLWLLALAVVVALALAHYRFWVGRLTVPARYAELHPLLAGDGEAIELRRVEPDPGDDRPPVLMVHGLAMNHRNHDWSEELSLSRRLARDGRDVWLLTLRSGSSSMVPTAGRRARFDRMVDYDLPAALDAIRERTGASAVDYVGFSMGGMLLYAALGQSIERDRVRRVVTIGSPARLDAAAALAPLVRGVPRALSPRIPLRLLGRMGSFAIDWVSTPFHRLGYNPDNVDPGVIGRALVNGFVDMPGPLNADFASWQGRAVTYAGRPVTDNLGDQTAPALFLAGAADRLATPDAVRLAFAHWGKDGDGVEKDFRVLGTATGTSFDYGHGDLLFGRDAPRDVYEPVSAFLSAGPAAPPLGA